MKKKIPKGSNPVAKARATGEHGAFRAIVIHTSKKHKKEKHKKSPQSYLGGDFSFNHLHPVVLTANLNQGFFSILDQIPPVTYYSKDISFFHLMVQHIFL